MKNQELLIKSALQYGLNVQIHSKVFGFYIVLGDKRYHFRKSCTPLNNAGSIALARDKYSTQSVLRDAGLPVPNSTYFEPLDYAKNEIDVSMLTYPLVCKPTTDTAGGEDVICNIESREELMHHLGRLLQKHPYVNVEEFKGKLKSYRVLIIDGQVAGVVYRKPASIIGDGLHSIATLIQKENQHKIKQIKLMGVTMSLINLNDPELPKRLKNQGLTLHSVPEEGQCVSLLYVCNSGRGGTIHSMGQQICEENAVMCIEAAKILGLNIVGFDVLCKDIKKPITETEGWFIEANYNPDLTLHEIPHTGPPMPVSGVVIRAFIRQHRFSFITSRMKNYAPMVALFGSMIGVFIVRSAFIA